MERQLRGERSAALRFDRVLACKSRNIDLEAPEAALELLGIEFHSAKAPGGSAIANEFDLDKYVVGKTLDGLFYMLGQEEVKIRTNPAAQTTELLKEVFAKR